MTHSYCAPLVHFFGYGYTQHSFPHVVALLLLLAGTDVLVSYCLARLLF